MGPWLHAKPRDALMEGVSGGAGCWGAAHPVLTGRGVAWEVLGLEGLVR